MAPAAGKAVTTRPRGDQRKARIIAAATDLFGRQGYGGTSLASIATAVDMTVPGLLHHYRTKELLLLAVLEERDRADGRRVFTAMNQEGLEVLVSLAGLVDHNCGVRGLVQLFTVLLAESVLEDHPANDYFVSRYRRIRDRMRRTIQAGQASGQIRPDVDPEQAAQVIVAVMDGLQTQWLLDPDRIDMRASFAFFADVLGGNLAESPRA